MVGWQVETDSERIAKEEVECKAIAADAQADLDVALPALEKAMAEVGGGGGLPYPPTHSPVFTSFSIHPSIPSRISLSIP